MTWKIWFIIFKNVSVMKDSGWGESYQVEKLKQCHLNMMNNKEMLFCY